MMDTSKPIATREAYGNALVELADSGADFVVMDADLAAATKTGIFKKAYPDRFFDVGIAEQNLMGVAAGFATTGKPVFASSFAMFAAGRAFEQVRNSIGYPHLNVKVCATHAGISVGEDGATHQCNEDIALMRSIPGMVVLNPVDAIETRKAIFAAAKHDGPVYVRLGRLAVGCVTTEDTPFEIGKAVTLRKGSDVTIIATGLMVHEALAAAEALESEGISAAVVNMATVKPLDKEAVLEAAKATGAIVTAEEHSIIGGLGEAVAAVLCENAPVPMQRVGVEDVFGKSGPAKEMLKRFGLSAENIAEKAKKAIAMK